MNRFEWMIENDRDHLLWLAYQNGDCRHCVKYNDCLALTTDLDDCEQGCKDWLLSKYDDESILGDECNTKLNHKTNEYLTMLSKTRNVVNDLISMNTELEFQLRNSKYNESRLAKKIDDLELQLSIANANELRLAEIIDKLTNS